ncbi:MAG: hypothetical protein GKR90_06310 [Pseudomonadales bacterium]|nr:hypothetical protein [Pseudomonadales bacterium]
MNLNLDSYGRSELHSNFRDSAGFQGHEASVPPIASRIGDSSDLFSLLKQIGQVLHRPIEPAAESCPTREDRANFRFRPPELT